LNVIITNGSLIDNNLDLGEYFFLNRKAEI